MSILKVKTETGICALGMTIYHIFDKGDNNWEIEEGLLFEIRQCLGHDLEIIEKFINIEGDDDFRKIPLSAFGKTAFCDRESAEEAIQKVSVISKAITHFKMGIDQDIFSEPVITYAGLAVEALENYREVLKNGLSGI